MKLTRYFYKRFPNEENLGILTEKGILDVCKAGEFLALPVPRTMSEVFVDSETQLALLNHLAAEAASHFDPSYIVNEQCIHYLPMSPNPEKIIGVGMNYADHAAEVIGEIPTNPVLFSKHTNALSAHLQDIPIPITTQQVDYEAELVIVIGKEGNNIPYSEALDYVFGYTVGNDFTARDLQFKTSQWMIGKSLNYFAPTGRVITTKDEIENPMNLDIKLTLNGEIRQDGNTKDMLFTVPYLINYISQYVPLKPGDLIFTSTPKGVIAGSSSGNKRWLKPNDEVEITIEGIGTLKNRLV